MKISSIVNILNSNSSYDNKEEDKQDQNIRVPDTASDRQDDRNYYLEREIENIKQKWNLFKYADEEFHIFKTPVRSQENVDMIFGRGSRK